MSRGPNYRLARNALGYWEIHWSESLPEAPGAWRSRRASTRTKDRLDAEQFLKGFVDEQERMRLAEQAGSVAGLLEDYLRDSERRGIGETQRRVLRPILRELGRRTPEQLTRSVLSEYAQTRKVSDSTLRRELGALNAALAHAVRGRVLTLDAVPHIALPPAGQARDLWLDEAEEAEFWALAQATTARHHTGQLSRVARFVALALDTAARRGAIQELTWARVDLAARRLDFRDPARAVTRKRRVFLPIADRLLPVLDRAQWEAKREGVHESAPVIGVGSIRRAYETWTSAPGFPYPHVTPHVMRHTWATLAARRGVSVWNIAGVLGDTVDTVTTTYMHHAPGHLMAAVNRPGVVVNRGQGLSP